MATENSRGAPPFPPEDHQKFHHDFKKRIMKAIKRQFAGKILWDWLQLLLVPIILAVGGYLFSDHQEHVKQIISENQRQDDILKTYLDNMSDLLLKNNLRNADANDDVRKVARSQTLVAIRRLDPEHKARLLQFLHEAELIRKGKVIIPLHNAWLMFTDAASNYNDLSDDDLSYLALGGAKLSSAVLHNTVLRGSSLNDADLSGANLSGADLSGAFLRCLDEMKQCADLSGANLSDATLSGATLIGANLSGANLSGANLSGANLSGANLRSAIVSSSQLKAARTLQGAIMPDGAKHN